MIGIGKAEGVMMARLLVLYGARLTRPKRRHYSVLALKFASTQGNIAIGLEECGELSALVVKALDMLLSAEESEQKAVEKAALSKLLKKLCS